MHQRIRIIANLTSVICTELDVDLPVFDCGNWVEFICAYIHKCIYSIPISIEGESEGNEPALVNTWGRIEIARHIESTTYDTTLADHVICTTCLGTGDMAMQHGLRILLVVALIYFWYYSHVRWHHAKVVTVLHSQENAYMSLIHMAFGILCDANVFAQHSTAQHSTRCVFGKLCVCNVVTFSMSVVRQNAFNREEWEMANIYTSCMDDAGMRTGTTIWHGVMNTYPNSEKQVYIKFRIFSTFFVLSSLPLYLPY